MPDELWMEVHNIVREAGIKSIPKKKKCKKAKSLSKEVLQTAKKRSERQRRKGKINPSLREVPLVSLIFLKRSVVFPILLFSSISLH